MAEAAFDTPGYAGRLEAAGFTRRQAEVQAEIFRSFAESQSEKNRQELATKGDLRETELRLLAEIEKVRGEIRSTGLPLLKWQWGIAPALAAIMAN